MSRYVAQFDSASAMLKATARFLANRPSPLRPPYAPANLLIRLANRMPEPLRDKLYIYAGWQEATRPHRLKRLQMEEVARWITAQYPARRYPGVLIGSSNGAAVHLASALGIPWLPQTVLIPVRQSGIHPDDMRGSMQFGQKIAGPLLAANPDVQLHHMHDPNQDRLMIRRMAYFRFKWLRLGTAFQQFLQECLAPGGTIFILNCQLQWPTTCVAERHLFQPGAYGGATAEEYVHGSRRVHQFLQANGSDRSQWDPPAPDAERPEAEWGFEPTLATDVQQLAERKGYRVRWISFRDPHDLSPLVAELYRWWYRQRGITADRLLIESFLLLEPWWSLRTGRVPFWTVFPIERSVQAVEHYIQTAGPFATLELFLFSHGMRSIGWTPLERWQRLLQEATQSGQLLGVDRQAFPKDFTTFIRYYQALRRLPQRHPLPDPLPLAALDEFQSAKKMTSDSILAD